MKPDRLDYSQTAAAKCRWEAGAALVAEALGAIAAWDWQAALAAHSF